MFRTGSAIRRQSGTPNRTARAGADGRFIFTGVPQGSYVILARAAGTPSPKVGVPSDLQNVAAKKAALEFQPANANQLWAMADVTADPRASVPIALALQPGMPVTGRADFEGAPPPADLSRVRLSLVTVGATDTGSPVQPVPLDADGRFTFEGVVPGRYRVARSVSGWTMKSAVANAQDTLDFPLEIKPGDSISAVLVTFSTRSSSLSGTLQDAAGQPKADYTVIVFPADSRYWLPQSRRVQAARPSTDGRFSFQGLPAGDYRLGAVTDVEPGQWYDPTFLRALLAASMPVALAEGERRVQDLRVAAR